MKMKRRRRRREDARKAKKEKNAEEEEERNCEQSPCKMLLVTFVVKDQVTDHCPTIKYC